MKLFYKDPLPDPKKTHEIVSAGYGTKHPERILGYEGTFLFHVPDVYVSDSIAFRMGQSKWLADRLTDMLKRFKGGNYGFVTQNESDNNCETRYFSFSSRWMIARYACECFDGIVFETMFDISLFYFPNEDISDVLEMQFQTCAKAWKTEVGQLTDYRNNDLQYIR